MPNRFVYGLTFVVTLFCVGACSPNQESKLEVTTPEMSALASASEQIIIKMKIDDNGVLERCAEDSGGCYTATLSIQLAEQMPSNWRIVLVTCHR